METKNSIAGRRSVRDYEDKKVPEKSIQEILKAGALAPSAMHKEPCRYIIIKDRKKIRELSEKVKDKAGLLGFGARIAERMKVKEDAIFYSAPLLILIVAEKDKWAETDCALAAQNMMLRAYDLGLGSCFIGFMRLIEDDKETMKELGIKDSQKLYCPLIFGYPKGKQKKADRKPRIQKTIE